MILQSMFNIIDLLRLHLLSYLISSDEISKKSLFLFNYNQFNISLVITHLINMVINESFLMP